MKASAALLMASLLAACSSAPSAPASSATPAAADPASLAAVTGVATLEGDAPPPEVIRLDSDPKCVALASGDERRSEAIMAGEGGALQNVFVYVKEGLPQQLYPVPSQPVVLDQQQCRYAPRVLGVQVGQPLAIRNSDPLLHNVRSEGAVNEPFDIGTPNAGMEVTRTFATREVMVPIKCNVHGWMRAYVGVLEHPYFAVTDASGRFALPQLPPGTYTIEAWHEQLGTRTTQVVVAAKETKDLTFTFKAS